MDALEGLRKMEDRSVDIIIADPPYNIGVDFLGNKRKEDMESYVEWCKGWIFECGRVLKESGTMYIYGFSEILAHISVSISLPHRWLIWHYTNKNVASSKFWQRSHESILLVWKNKEKRVFNLDSVREDYTETFLKNAAGKTRKGTKGRFSSSNKETVYEAHPAGALPRDVIKVAALAGGAGASERIGFCRTCDEAFVGSKNLKNHKSKEHDVFKHPTQKPSRLTEKMIKAAAPESEDAVVVLPFAGSGSEALVAASLGVDFVGFEIEGEFCKMANSLIERQTKQKE